MRLDTKYIAIPPLAALLIACSPIGPRDSPAQSVGAVTTLPEIHEDVSRELYAPIEKNKVKRVSAAPLSTFSIDVDTASYTNARRFISNGRLPIPDAVRTEEFINYFSYDYSTPEKGDSPFAVTYEIAPTPWNANTHLIHIGLKAYEQPIDEAPPSNLVFLVDVSGSMASSNKLALVQKSLKLLVNQMGEEDSIALVVYAGAAGVVLPPTSADNKSTIKSAIRKLRAGGSTNGSEGIELAYEVATEAFIKGGNNRVVIATDGDFNVGISDIKALKRLIAQKSKLGIDLTTVGVGTGNYNDHLMETLSNTGNGNAIYLDSLREAKKAFVHELQSNLQTVAKDVKIQVEFNPSAVSDYRLIGYENRALADRDFTNDKKDAGDIGSGHTVTAIYEITLNAQYSGADNKLRYAEHKQPGVLPSEIGYVKIRYKQPTSDKSTQFAVALLADEVQSSNKATSDNFRFSAAVAAFAESLRGEEQMSYSDIVNMARSAKGTDEYGYRSEFIELVRLTKEIDDPKSTFHY